VRKTSLAEWNKKELTCPLRAAAHPAVG
jgi:hypothetical protein